jgi:hypothetical protein
MHGQKDKPRLAARRLKTPGRLNAIQEGNAPPLSPAHAPRPPGRMGESHHSTPDRGLLHELAPCRSCRFFPRAPGTFASSGRFPQPIACPPRPWACLAFPSTPRPSRNEEVLFCPRQGAPTEAACPAVEGRWSLGPVPPWDGTVWSGSLQEGGTSWPVPAVVAEGVVSPELRRLVLFARDLLAQKAQTAQCAGGRSDRLSKSVGGGAHRLTLHPSTGLRPVSRSAGWFRAESDAQVLARIGNGHHGRGWDSWKGLEAC